MSRILISGRGGCGKSTIVTAFAKKLVDMDKKVLVIDGDESNLCLTELLGINKAQQSLLENNGGKPKVLPEMMQANMQNKEFHMVEDVSYDELPEEYVYSDGNLSFIEVGKIEHHGEGCACAMGTILYDFLNTLKSDDEIILIDIGAGLEHFGRGILDSVDQVITIVDNSKDAVKLANAASSIVKEADKHLDVIFNKTTDKTEELLKKTLDDDINILGRMSYYDSIAEDNINGNPMDISNVEVCDLIRKLEI